MVDFGMRLKELRQNKHMTQAQLAERLWITKSMVSAYETSVRTPSYEVLIKISAYFNVTTDYLLGVEKQNVLYVPNLTDHQKQAILSLVDAFQIENS